MKPGDTAGAHFGLDARGVDARRRLGRLQAAVGALCCVALLATLAAFALTGSPAQARRPRLFGGTVVLDDTRGPVVLDLATGEPTLRLQGVAGDVGAAGPSQVAATAVQGGTLLLDDATGSFNFLDESSLVTKPTGGGVALPRAPGTLRATAFPAGADAYVVRYRRGGTDVALVDEATVAQAASAAAAARKATAPTGGDSAPRRLVRAASVTVPLPGAARLDARVLARPGAAVTAGGRLWALATTARGTELLELTPGPGAALEVHARGGAAPRGALATAAAGRAAVGLAEPGRLEVFLPGPRGLAVRHVALPGTARARSVVAVGGAAGASPVLWYVFQGGGPDRLVGVRAATGRLLVDRRLAGMPAGRVVAPALDGGRIYALVDDGSRRPPLVVVDPGRARARPLAGAPRYPLATATEAPTFAHPEILAEGPRVVVNNPDSLLAVVVFTGSGRAHVVDKRLAALVDPSAPPAALEVHRPAVRTPHRPHHAAHRPRPARRPSAPTTTTTTLPAPSPPVVPTHVDVQLSCANTNQKPRAPELLPATPGTTSVALSWSYQLLTSEDCAPTSYAVHVTAEPGTTPPARSVYAVQGATGLQVTGLRPSSSYQLVVTAFIGHQSTSSAPEVVTTEAAGPDAPTKVTATANGTTGWDLSWHTCAGQACISPDPVVAFSVRAESCGGGYVGSPPVLTVAAGSDQATYPFSLDPALVGTALRFSVQAVGADGLVSDVATGGGCPVGWRPASAQLVALDAGGTVTPKGTVTASLSLALSAPANQALGSYGTELVYAVGDRRVGPTTADQVQVPGLPAGVAAPTSVTVYPAGHPGAAVTVEGPPLTVTTPWPSLALTAAESPLPSDPNLGKVTVHVAGAFVGLPSGTPLVASGQVVCGSTATAFATTPVTADGAGGGTAAFGPLDLTANGGPCTLDQVRLSETTSNVHGGASPALSVPLPVAGAAEPGPSDFGLRWLPPPSSWNAGLGGVSLEVTGSAPPALGTRWQVASVNLQAAGQSCTVPGPPRALAGGTFTVLVDPSSCLAGTPPGTVVTATAHVRWLYLGAVQEVDVTSDPATVPAAAAATSGGGNPPPTTGGATTTTPPTTATTLPPTTSTSTLPPTTTSSTTATTVPPTTTSTTTTTTTTTTVPPTTSTTTTTTTTVPTTTSTTTTTVPTTTSTTTTTTTVPSTTSTTTTTAAGG